MIFFLLNTFYSFLFLFSGAVQNCLGLNQPNQFCYKVWYNKIPVFIIPNMCKKKSATSIADFICLLKKTPFDFYMFSMAVATKNYKSPKNNLYEHHKWWKEKLFPFVSLSFEISFVGRQKVEKCFFPKLCISESFKILYSLSVS